MKCLVFGTMRIFVLVKLFVFECRQKWKLVANISSNELCSFNAQLLTFRVLCAFDNVSFFFSIFSLLECIDSKALSASFHLSRAWFISILRAHIAISHLKSFTWKIDDVFRTLFNFMCFIFFWTNIHVSHDLLLRRWKLLLNKCSQHLLIRT